MARAPSSAYVRHSCVSDHALGGAAPARLSLRHGPICHHQAMPSTNRPGSTTRWRKLRAYVLERDRYQCQACPEPHQLTTHDQTLGTHAHCGHKRGHEWAATQATSWDPEDYQAECSRSNTSHGATFGNQLRGASASSVGASRRWP